MNKRFPDQLLDEIRARVRVSDVVRTKVKLKKAGREWSGLSPFKAEKTASFYVNDQKMFWHCFASSEHGDIFAFLMKTEGVTFPEAVERLAEQAGVSIPELAPEVAEEMARLSGMRDALIAAEQFFVDIMPGRGAAYADERGITQAARAEFRIGYAPDSNSKMRDELLYLGHSQADIIGAGLSARIDSFKSKGQIRDRFRDRLVIPIHDWSGKIVGFGGRALEKKEGVPKYLNPPETDLFHKGSILFNAHRARVAAHESGRVVLVEGYLDVISMWQAGIKDVVAPMGTALTVDQLQILWKMSAEPIICLDGDAAGFKAAMRTIDTALPFVSGDRSLSFAFIPAGADPDDMCRDGDPTAMEGILSNARPLADVLWEREFSAGTWDTPERKVRLKRRLQDVANMIKDRATQAAYGSYFKGMLRDVFSGKKERGPSSALLNSRLVREG